MELCTFQNPNTIKLITSSTFPLYIPSLSISTYNPGRVYRLTTSLRATPSEETSTGSYAVEEPVTRVGYKPAEKISYAGSETAEKEEYAEDTPTDVQTQAFEFLDNLDVKACKSKSPEFSQRVDDLEMQLDSGDTPSLLLLGGGSVIAFWIATVLVGAIDSIPLFPKMMEVVGLSYTLWFSTRYLLFKKNREELVVKIDEIKQQVLGSKGDD